MNTPIQKQTSAYQKAIRTLQHQCDSHQGALDNLKLARVVLNEGLEREKAGHAKEVAKINGQIADYERELADTKAAILKIQKQQEDDQKKRWMLPVPGIKLLVSR